MTNDVFLSYRRTDQPLARALVTALETRGVRVWWDQDIEGGHDWREAIVEGLSGSQALVILFSENCNKSKQLKKELAIADTLDKEIIPVLIEDTTPKGHYLYELAARNWVQIYPEPMSKVGELADRLARELQTDNGPRAESMMTRSDVVPRAEEGAPPGLTPPTSPPGASRRMPESERPAESVDEMVRTTQSEKNARAVRRNFLPFKWYEILAVFALAGLVGWSTYDTRGFVDLALFDTAMAASMIAMVVAVIVFPVRYYFRRLRVWRAVRYYALSNLVLAVIMGVFVGVHPEISGGGEDFQAAPSAPMGMEEITITASPSAGGFDDILYGLIGSIVIIAIVSLIAFCLYGLLHFQRTMRSFNSNVEAI